MPNKSLGQHWLKDRLILEAIADSFEIDGKDVVLEIGPGLGTLTSVLLKKAQKVVAVEYDELLAKKLPGQFPGKQLEVINADFLEFDLTLLPIGYKVVANVPYYITQKIIEHLLVSENRPISVALLVQKEVAEKLAAKPGSMTVVAVWIQLLYEIKLGVLVDQKYFTPPPKVDSQVVVFTSKKTGFDVEAGVKQVMRLVRTGFLAPRKKLYAVLAGGLRLEKNAAKNLLEQSGVDPEARAAELSVDDWVTLSKNYASI